MYLFFLIFLLPLIVNCTRSVNSSSQTALYAIYFPQFHEDPLNNEVWGQGYSDWDNVRSASPLNRANRPVLQPHKDIGYYNLANKETRKKQAEMAKENGIDGFIIYHYWFYHDNDLQVLSLPLLKLLEDGEPNIPFAFSWAAAHWLRLWVGNTAKVRENGGKYYHPNPKYPQLLYEQICPYEDDAAIAQHYAYLRQFFHHPNYIKINGTPLFNYFKYSDAWKCLHILPKLQKLAREDGFPGLGLYIVGGEYTMEDHELYNPNATMIRDHPEDGGLLTSNLYFPVWLKKPIINILPESQVPSLCLQKPHEFWQRNNETHYIGIMTSFDNTPRRPVHNASIAIRKHPGLSSLQAFEYDLANSLYYEQCCFSPETRETGGKFITIAAWNEWGEGMVLEPSRQEGYSYLHAVKRMKRKMRSIGCDAQRFNLLLHDLYLIKPYHSTEHSENGRHHTNDEILHDS